MLPDSRFSVTFVFNTTRLLLRRHIKISWSLRRSACFSIFSTSDLFCETRSFSRSLHFSCCRCYNCGGLDHHAKECSLPPQPKKCHCCQSITHMVANCPHKTVVPPPAASQGRQEAEPQPCTAFPREVGGGHGYPSPPFPQEARSEVSEWPGTSPAEASSTKSSAAPEDQSKKGPSVQKRKKT